MWVVKGKWKVIYNLVVDFKEWITQQYLEWRGDAYGRTNTVSDFADYLDVKQQMVSSWMNGNSKPSLKSINKLAFRLGYEVYDVLEIPEDERPVRYDIRKLIQKVPPENQEELRDLIERYLIGKGWERID